MVVSDAAARIAAQQEVSTEEVAKLESSAVEEIASSQAEAVEAAPAVEISAEIGGVATNAELPAADPETKKDATILVSATPEADGPGEAVDAGAGSESAESTPAPLPPEDSAQRNSATPEEGVEIAKLGSDTTPSVAVAPPVAAAAGQEASEGTKPDAGETKRRPSAARHTVETQSKEPAAAQPSDAALDAADEVRGERNADADVSSSRERPAPNSESFQSILERTTGPAGRRAVSAEPPPNEPPRVDAQRFVARVTRAFHAAEQRGGSVQLRLSPPELGAMKIELNIQHGSLTAKLETETAAAKSVLLDNLPALRERLAAQDIRVDKFEVDVRQQGSGDQPNWEAQQESRDTSRHRSQQSGRASQPRAMVDASEGNSTTSPITNHDGQFSAVA
ncbi:flagellar hook-length control protein FliK [Rubripirellula amarantea]|nr:flagellar hook-length control protein FliK [Rubripirellula amarantea]